MMWLLISVWLILGVLNYGAVMAYAWNEWPLLHRKYGWSAWRKDQAMAISLGVLGPIGSSIVATNGIFRHGFLFRRPKNVKPL